jgi:hypothetical protein
MAEKVKMVKYRAKDGTLCDSEAEADDLDRTLAAIDAAMSRLAPRSDGMAFTDGRGYVQHDPADVKRAREAIFRAAAKEQAWYFAKHPEADTAETAHPLRHILGRILDDSGSLFYRPWMRLACIDDAGREWGQPYFALHPDKAGLQEAIG